MAIRKSEVRDNRIGKIILKYFGLTFVWTFGIYWVCYGVYKWLRWLLTNIDNLLTNPLFWLWVCFVICTIGNTLDAIAEIDSMDDEDEE